MTQQWKLDVTQDGNGECFIELTDEILEASGFKEGDELKWVDNLDGSYTIMHTHMEGYYAAGEFANPKTNRHARIYRNKISDEMVIDMFEHDELIYSRKIDSHAYEYGKDCVENWVMCYGEFKDD